MIENSASNVSLAFEILLEEVETEIDFVNKVGARSFTTRDYEKIKEALERAGLLAAFRDRIATLRREWNALAAAAEKMEDDATREERQNLGRLRKGQRTPESAYYQPILEVLNKMGGSGKVVAVLDEIGRIMTPILKEVDHDPLASDSSNPRWRNAAQWARNSMVQEGLLRADSQRGVWEITSLGRARLTNQHQGAKA